MEEAVQRADQWKASRSEHALCRYLDTPYFRGSFLGSSWTLLQTTALMLMWWYAAASFSGSAGIVGCVGFAVAWALLVLRSYMIFHDAGHGSFFQGFPGAKRLNWATLQLSAVMCGTPTDWNVGHQLHHANVGNLGQDDYDWGETIFLTAAQYLRLPKWKQAMWKAIRHPVPFFLLAPALTWWVKMKLPFELRPERKAAYRFSDKLVSFVAMFLRYKAAIVLGPAMTALGGGGLLPMVLAGDYLAMFVGVLLFHWQHVYDKGYVKGAAEWKIKDASMLGSSFTCIPTPLKFFTLGIEYHHIHHFRTKMPGYMLRTVHELAPADMWADVAVLGPKEMWRSLALQCWDEDTQTYATFREVEQRAAAEARCKATKAR